MNEAPRYEAVAVVKTTPTAAATSSAVSSDEDTLVVKFEPEAVTEAAAPATEKSSEGVTNTNADRTYRMVALDLDGTLLSDDRKIAVQQVEYLRQLHLRGFTVCIATGRAPTGVYDHVNRLGIQNLPVVCSNGARGFYCSPTSVSGSSSSSSSDSNDATATAASTTVTATARATSPSVTTTEKLFYDPVPPQIVERTLKLSNELGYAIQYYTEDDCVYANQKNPTHYKMTQQYSDYTGVRIDHADDEFESLLSDGPDRQLPSKLLVLFDEQDPEIARRHFTNEFSNDEATVVKGYCTWFLEILSPSVNKGQGLKRMCSALKIPLEEVIAIGDGCNDIEFLEMAGLGVAVANAEPEVKDCADFTSQHTNDQHGVMKVLQELDGQNRLTMK